MSVQPWLGLTGLLPSVGRDRELGQCMREHLQHPALMARSWGKQIPTALCCISLQWCFWDPSLPAIQACAGAPLQQTRSRVQRTQTAGTLGSATAGKSQRKPSCTLVLGATHPCPPCPVCLGKEVAFLHGHTGWGAGAGAPHGTAAEVAGTSTGERRALCI